MINFVYLLGVERDPMYEAFHMAQMIYLYKNFYNKPIREALDTCPTFKVCTIHL